MKFSKTTEYALRIMSFMAADEKKLYRADDIYDHLKIPYRYLRKLMTTLSGTGLIQSVQGKNGGYSITRSLDEIFLIDILRAIGEDQLTETCFFGFDDCAFLQKCSMHDKWQVIRDNIYNILSTTNLAELKEKGPSSYTNLINN